MRVTIYRTHSEDYYRIQSKYNESDLFVQETSMQSNCCSVQSLRSQRDICFNFLPLHHKIVQLNFDRMYHVS